MKWWPFNRTVSLRDMKTDDEVWWEEQIKVPEGYVDQMWDELCDEVNELRETNAHLENTITDLKEKLRRLEAGERVPHSVVKSNALRNPEAKRMYDEEETADWKRVNYYAEHQASSLPDDIGYIEILIKGGCDEQTEEIILDSFPEFYADIWGRNPDKIYRVRSTGLPKPDIEDMQQVWPEKVVDDVIIDYGDTSIKQLCKQIDKLIQENKNLSKRISLLNAELDMLQDELVACSAYSEQLEKLLPKKKLKKFWKKQRNLQ